MSDKQQLLKAIEALPDGATWGEIAPALLEYVARRASFTPGQIAELGARLGAITGVDAEEVRTAAAEADAGRLVPHAAVFARLRARS
ncbi:MAG TPA: hypothetical protein VGE74_18295 [Gemmata sp.]